MKLKKGRLENLAKRVKIGRKVAKNPLKMPIKSIFTKNYKKFQLFWKKCKKIAKNRDFFAKKSSFLIKIEKNEPKMTTLMIFGQKRLTGVFLKKIQKWWFFEWKFDQKCKKSKNWQKVENFSHFLRFLTKNPFWGSIKSEFEKIEIFDDFFSKKGAKIKIFIKKSVQKTWKNLIEKWLDFPCFPLLNCPQFHLVGRVKIFWNFKILKKF